MQCLTGASYPSSGIARRFLAGACFEQNCMPQLRQWCGRVKVPNCTRQMAHCVCSVSHTPRASAIEDGCPPMASPGIGGSRMWAQGSENGDSKRLIAGSGWNKVIVIITSYCSCIIFEYNLQVVFNTVLRHFQYECFDVYCRSSNNP